MIVRRQITTRKDSCGSEEDVYKSIGPDNGSGSSILETIKMSNNGFN